ncbi:MAG: thiamine ABC transporter substrate-binding protein, partial [Treponema sp.]|nr:thiamine ABC transporter substrate-binding protein [Treponema sp.]
MGGKKYFPDGSRALLALLGVILAAAPLFGGGGRDKAEGGAREVVVWTYDSFNSEWGPGPEISGAFEEATGIRI